MSVVPDRQEKSLQVARVSGNTLLRLRPSECQSSKLLQKRLARQRSKNGRQTTIRGQWSIVYPVEQCGGDGSAARCIAAARKTSYDGYRVNLDKTYLLHRRRLAYGLLYLLEFLRRKERYLPDKAET
jgi:hypothetical protein